MPNKSIFNDPYFPRVEKSVAKNDFVVNKESIDGIVPLSVGVVKGVNDTLANVYFIGKRKLLDIDVSNLVVIDVYKTGKEKATTTPPFKYKICNICFVLKNQSTDFDYNQNDKQGRPTTRPSCKSCRVGIDGKNMSAYERRRMESIKPKDYELFECPICHKISIPGVTADIRIDHDHRTGKARAWICDSCNTGIGRFQDSPEMFEKIADYIKKHNTDLEQSPDLF